MSTFVADLGPFGVSAFRRYLMASSLGFTSLWMYVTVAAWMLLELTGSATVAGLLLMAMAIPVPFAMVAAGPLTDRLGPRTIVSIAFGVQGVAVLGTALLAMTGQVSIPLVLLLAALLGIADGFVIVSSQVLAGRTVDARAMPAAVTLGMLAIGVGRIIGAPIGGGVTAIAGPSVGLLLAGIGFIVAAGLILRVPRKAGIGGTRISLGDLREGLAWVRTSRTAIIVIALGAVGAMFLWPYLGLLAPYTREALDGDARTLGIIVAAGGVGAVVAAMTVGIAARIFGPMRVLVVAAVGGGVLLFLFGLAPVLPASLLVSMGLSLALLSVAAMGSLILQSSAPLELRGRVLAINGFVVFVLMPISIAVVGLAADLWGVGRVMMTMGMLAVGMMLLVVLIANRGELGARLRRVGPAMEPAMVIDGVGPAIGDEPIGPES